MVVISWQSMLCGQTIRLSRGIGTDRFAVERLREHLLAIPCPIMGLVTNDNRR